MFNSVFIKSYYLRLQNHKFILIFYMVSYFELTIFLIRNSLCQKLLCKKNQNKSE